MRATRKVRSSNATAAELGSRSGKLTTVAECAQYAADVGGLLRQQPLKCVFESGYEWMTYGIPRG